MKVITITLNPAFDVHCDIEAFEMHKENYATSYIKHAGGKGINISRALTKYGIDNIACCVVGNENGKEFLSKLDKDNMEYKAITVEGRIRENITVHTENKETRISFEGFDINETVLCDFYNEIKSESDKDTVVTFTGRLPKGVEKDAVIEVLRKIKATGARLIVDCNSFSLDDLIQIEPYLIKPNEEEIEKLVGKKICNDVMGIAREIYQKGIKNVIISLGGDGFVYCGEWGEYEIKTPEIAVISTIGAGDSLISGFVSGLCEGIEPIDILIRSAAFGTAACMEEGTNPPSKEKVELIEQKIKKSLL